MSQSLVQNYLHVIFSTKDRRPFLATKELRDRTHAYLAGTCNQLDSPCLTIGGVEDHVHIACRLSKSMKICDFIRELKRESSKAIKEFAPQLSDFYWQSGYAAFSVSPSYVPALIQYITDQEEHHRKESFQDELRRICKTYGLELDERYAWD